MERVEPRLDRVELGLVDLEALQVRAGVWVTLLLWLLQVGEGGLEDQEFCEVEVLEDRGW